MRKKNALTDLNLEVQKGEIFGYLGPNGAGKTTTIKLLINLISPTRGSIEIFGQDVKVIGNRSNIGFLPDRPYFYEYLTGGEFLHYCAKLYGLEKSKRSKRIDELLELVNLQHDKNIQLRKYSQGMLQRAGFAQALLNNPDLLILDEPLTALDPLGRRQFKTIIQQLKNEGKTVFFSSHILEDAEDICDRVGILVKGRLIKTGVLKDFLEEKIEFFEITADAGDKSVSRKIKMHNWYSGEKGRFHLVKVENSDDIQAAVDFIYNAGGRVFSISPRRRKLEDIFLEEVKREGNNKS